MMSAPVPATATAVPATATAVPAATAAVVRRGNNTAAEHHYQCQNRGRFDYIFHDTSPALLQ
ncbi:DUF3762 domain-containing protein [Erwinia sp. E602]|nr:DUF3762 domain-containing protein [Erwinia sp. E602]